MKYYILEGNLNNEVPVDGSFHKVLEDHHAYIQKFFENGKILALHGKLGTAERREGRAR